MAIGHYSTASGDWSFAGGSKGTGGVNSTAGGKQSLSFGLSTQALGNSSQAFGQATIANTVFSTTFGNNTISTGRASMVIGQYNIEDTSDTTEYSMYGSNARKYLFTIGNGTADNARSNALTVDWNGNTTIAGSLTLNGTTTITATDVSNWNNSSIVSISPTLTSGTKIGTVTIDGTSTDLYSEPNTDTKVTQNAAITTSGAYPILLGNSTVTTAITDTVNKTSTLTYNPSTRNLNVPSITTDEIHSSREVEITGGNCILHLNEEVDQETYRNKFVYVGNNYNSMIDLNESFATIETNPTNGQNPGAYMCVYTDEVKAGLQDNSGGHLEIGSYGVSLIYGDPDSSSSSPYSYVSVTDDTMVEICSTAEINLQAPNIQMGRDSQVEITKLSLPNASNSNTYSSGTAGQVLTTNGTNVYWGTVSTEDTKVNVSTRGTTKAYLLADTTAPTSTAAAHTAVAESNVYLDTTAGALAATTYKIAEAVTLQYNSTTQALDFIFA